MTVVHATAYPLAQLVADTAKAQNTDILASDFQLTEWTTSVRLSIAATAVKVKLVPSSGTAFYINGGDALTASTVHTEDVLLDTGRTWNLQTDDAGGITVYHLRVIELET